MKYLLIIILFASCSTRKVVIDEVKKDSLVTINSKIVTKEDVKIETKNDVITDEFTITPLDSCKDIVVDGKTYRNVVLTYKKTKDNTTKVEKKIASKIEDKQQSTKNVVKQKIKEVKKKKSFNWILILVIIVFIWLSRQALLRWLRKI